MANRERSSFPAEEIISLVDMAPERWSQWVRDFRSDYVESRVRAGESRAQTEKAVAAQFESVFPHGEPLHTHRYFDIFVTASAEIAGYLWIGPRDSESDEWWIYGVEVDLLHRRRGYARAALAQAHDLARTHGARSMELSVFGYNTEARELYDSLGYEVSAIRMSKTLS